MEYLPFLLVVGTGKPNANNEEYRWAILDVQSEPERNAVFCRNGTKMNVPFLLSFFAYSPIYNDLNSLFQGIKDSGIKAPYMMQIEHFPSEHFPNP